MFIKLTFRNIQKQKSFIVNAPVYVEACTWPARLWLFGWLVG